MTTVVAYMGYGRQDEAFKTGQPVSARAMARAVSTGTDRVVLVNPHESAIASFYDVPVTTVDAAPSLAGPLPDDLTDPLFLSPDAGATELAVSVRDAHGSGETDYFEKHRDRETGEIDISPSDAPVADRDVVVVDDIIATGSTMSEAIAVLNDRDAARVYAAAVHPLLVGNAVTKLENAGIERIFGTDTVERACSTVSAADAIATEL